MTAAIDALACPSCGSNAVSTEWRNLDPKTGKPTKTPLMTILLSSLLALAGAVWLLLVVLMLIDPTPGVSFGGLDLFLTLASVGAIINLAQMLHRALARGRQKSCFCWCRVCASEWVDQTGRAASGARWASSSSTGPTPAGPPAVTTPPASPVSAAATAAPAPEPSAPAHGPTEGGGLRWMMEAIRTMPLPEKLRGWNQVISVECRDQPDLWYRWVIQGDQWQVLAGQTFRPTLRLVADKEDDLAKRFALGYTGAVGYSLLLPSGLSAGPGSYLKVNALIMGITGYLPAAHAPALAAWQATRMGRKYGIGSSMPVDRLVEALGSADVEARKAAADALEASGWSPPPEKAEAYWAAKQDWDRAWTATAPASPADIPARVEYLLGHLKRKGPTAVRSLVDALVDLGPAAMPSLFEHYRHAGFDTTLLVNMASAITGIFNSPRPLEQQIELLKYPLKPAQRNLEDKLAAAGPDIVEPLLIALRDDDVELRRSAVEILGRIGDARAADPIRRLSDDQDRRVRQAAVEALTKIAAHSVVPV